MTTLTIYPDASPKKPDVVTSDPAEIGRLLNAVGVRFECWKADAELAPNATPEQVLAAYKTEVARLSAEAGYKTIDVIRITPDNPKKDELRTKFIRPVYLDTELHVRGRVRGVEPQQNGNVLVDLFVWCEDEHGMKLTDGDAKVEIAGR